MKLLMNDILSLKRKKINIQMLNLSKLWKRITGQPIIEENAKHCKGFLKEHINSGNFSEQITSLPVSPKGVPYQKIVLFSERLTDIKKGEVILVLSQFETTNNLGFNVMLASRVVLADSPTSAIGIEITEASGFNITPNMHHGKTVEVGTMVSPRDYATKYVNVYAYAASTAASPGDTIKVEKDYGRLSVLRFNAP